MTSSEMVMALLRERVPLTLLVDLAGLGGTSEDVYRSEVVTLDDDLASWEPADLVLAAAGRAS